MLVFLIHGVATQNAGYGDKFKKKVKELILEAKANRDTVAEETSKKNGEANDITMPIFFILVFGDTPSKAKPINFLIGYARTLKK